MYDDVLVPTDGSEGIDEVLDHALELATDHDATVHTLYVVDQRLYLAADDDDQDAIRDSIRNDGEAALAAVESRVTDAGLTARTGIREGIPYRDILEYADEWGIDVIVMGTHGRTGRDRLAHLGSVTDRVLKNAAVPVFVIHIGDAGNTE